MSDDSVHTDASSLPGRETFPPASDLAQVFPSPFGVPLGANLVDGQTCEFRVWAPAHERVEVHILAPEERRVVLEKMPDGYHEAVVRGCPEGTRYRYVLGEKERPDPASRYQPDGPHGPSEVVGRGFEWHDEEWKGLPLADYVIYELHVGAFTPEGTFDAVIPHLDQLRELGITAIELLPVAQFPGDRNWGYDGTYVHATQNSYGGPRALKRLVDACHQRGLAILLDVVYNHLGPEGNYLGEYGPYFTDRYKTPWGLALNFDGPMSDDVRWYFVHSALQWVDEFHFDGLRVDAVHAIVDHSAQPFLQDLTVAVHKRAETLGRKIHMIAESDLNDPRVITSEADFGLGFDSQWSDDYHHTLHVMLTGERTGYYMGFEGRPTDLGRILQTGYLYTGQHSPYRGRKYGLEPKTRNGASFVVSAQNHDQVGNRMMGDRLAALVSFDKVRLAAAAIVLSPFIPMIFMGEEYGEKAPFQYFTSHTDEALIEAVRKGRREEFEDFVWEGEAPDPHDEATFLRSKLQWDLIDRGEHASIRRLFRELLRLRREVPALRRLDIEATQVHADDDRRLVLVHRSADQSRALIGFNFGERTQIVEIPFAAGEWKMLIDTGGRIEGGRLTLPPNSFGLWGT